MKIRSKVIAFGIASSSLLSAGFAEQGPNLRASNTHRATTERRESLAESGIISLIGGLAIIPQPKVYPSPNDPVIDRPIPPQIKKRRDAKASAAYVSSAILPKLSEAGLTYVEPPPPQNNLINSVPGELIVTNGNNCASQFVVSVKPVNGKGVPINSANRNVNVTIALYGSMNTLTDWNAYKRAAYGLRRDGGHAEVDQGVDINASQPKAVAEYIEQTNNEFCSKASPTSTTLPSQ